jgi:hypothetical protein
MDMTQQCGGITLQLKKQIAATWTLSLFSRKLSIEMKSIYRWAVINAVMVVEIGSSSLLQVSNILSMTARLAATDIPFFTNVQQTGRQAEVERGVEL